MVAQVVESQTVSALFGLNIPKPYKSKQSPDKTSNDNLMIGLELEIENIGNGQNWYAERAGNFWSVVEDGSLRPRGEAWEFVSKPATLGVALAELRIFFEKFRFTDANYTDRCSVHVHTNVLDFTQEQVANLALVYPVFESVMFQYVNHHKQQDEQGYCRDTNLYCIPWSDCRMNRNFVERFFASPGQVVGERDRFGHRLSGWQKYTALNLLPIGQHGTVEWRHMHGTADMEKLTTWLNMIGAIMKFCKENDFDDIVKTIKILNDTSAYQQFFNAVMAGTLAYVEEYRVPMSEGVINAKYSLVNWEANKGKPKAKAAKSLYDDWATIRVQEDPIPAPAEDITQVEREFQERQARILADREERIHRVRAADRAQMDVAARTAEMRGDDVNNFINTQFPPRATVWGADNGLIRPMPEFRQAARPADAPEVRVRRAPERNTGPLPRGRR